jgi:hypothetical protein
LSHQAAAAAAAAGAEDADEDGSGEESAKGAAGGGTKESYDYLLSMAIYSLTWEKVQVRRPNLEQSKCWHGQQIQSLSFLGHVVGDSCRKLAAPTSTGSSDALTAVWYLLAKHADHAACTQKVGN